MWLPLFNENYVFDFASPLSLSQFLYTFIFPLTIPSTNRLYPYCKALLGKLTVAQPTSPPLFNTSAKALTVRPIGLVQNFCSCLIDPICRVEENRDEELPMTRTVLCGVI